jgi:hypothetical protein
LYWDSHGSCCGSVESHGHDHNVLVVQLRLVDKGQVTGEFEKLHVHAQNVTLLSQVTQVTSQCHNNPRDTMATKGHFTKLDHGITGSTLWKRPDDVLRVWIFMLAKADIRDGVVRYSIPMLAHDCFMTIERAVEIIAELSSPDTYSRTKTYEGRRIAEVEGGWRILNFESYRDGLEEPLSPGAARTRKWREKKAAAPEPKKPVTSPTSPCDEDVDVDGDVETKQKQEKKQRAPARALELSPIPFDVWVEWNAYRAARGKGWTEHAKSLSLSTLKKLHAEGHDPRAVVNQSIERGWTGLFAIKPENGNGGPRKLSVVERIEKNIRDRREREDAASTFNLEAPGADT